MRGWTGWKGPKFLASWGIGVEVTSSPVPSSSIFKTQLLQFLLFLPFQPSLPPQLPELHFFGIRGGRETFLVQNQAHWVAALEIHISTGSLSLEVYRPGMDHVVDRQVNAEWQILGVWMQDTKFQSVLVIDILCDFKPKPSSLSASNCSSVLLRVMWPMEEARLETRSQTKDQCAGIQPGHSSLWPCLHTQ